MGLLNTTITRNWESVWLNVLPQYKLIGCHGIKSMTLIRVDDMYNVSPLSWKGTPDISSLGPYNIWHRYSKSVFFYKWLKFWIRVNEYSSRDSNSNLAHPLTFCCRTNFAKIVFIVVGSPYEYWCKRSIYTKKNYQWIKYDIIRLWKCLFIRFLVVTYWENDVWREVNIERNTWGVAWNDTTMQQGPEPYMQEYQEGTKLPRLLAEMGFVDPIDIRYSNFDGIYVVHKPE